MARNYSISALILTALVIVLAACGDGDKDPDFYTQSELEDAVKERFSEYTWPELFEISSDDIIGELQFPENSRFEPTYEYMVLSGYHTCAWEITLINAIRESNELLIEESMYQLMSAEHSEYQLMLDETAQTSKKRLYESATDGNPIELQDWVRNNCGRVKPYFQDQTTGEMSTRITHSNFAPMRIVNEKYIPLTAPFS